LALLCCCCDVRGAPARRGWAGPSRRHRGRLASVGDYRAQPRPQAGPAKHTAAIVDGRHFMRPSPGPGPGSRRPRRAGRGPPPRQPRCLAAGESRRDTPAARPHRGASARFFSPHSVALRRVTSDVASRTSRLRSWRGLGAISVGWRRPSAGVASRASHCPVVDCVSWPAAGGVRLRSSGRIRVEISLRTSRTIDLHPGRTRAKLQARPGAARGRGPSSMSVGIHTRRTVELGSDQAGSELLESAEIRSEPGEDLVVLESRRICAWSSASSRESWVLTRWIRARGSLVEGLVSLNKQLEYSPLGALSRNTFDNSTRRHAGDGVFKACQNALEGMFKTQRNREVFAPRTPLRSCCYPGPARPHGSTWSRVAFVICPRSLAHRTLDVRSSRRYAGGPYEDPGHPLELRAFPITEGRRGAPRHVVAARVRCWAPGVRDPPAWARSHSPVRSDLR